MTITAKDFQDFVRERLKDAATPELFRERLKEVTEFGIANETAMDAEANASYDEFMEAFATVCEISLTEVADSPTKRKVLRLAALTKRKHHHVGGLLKGLGRPLPTPFPVAEMGKVIFLEVLQSVLDLLFDATRQHQKGPAAFASLSMLYWTIDELTVAFYLSERKYTTQAFSHLRTAYDLLAKAELFSRQPQWADVWTGVDKLKILKELSPGAVRKKLGKPKFDPVYDFLTERGMHGTWGAVRQRVASRGESQGTTRVAMWMGGTPFDKEVDIAVSSCILTALSTLLTVANVFAARLHPEEVVEIIKSSSDLAVKFLGSHFIQPLQEAGADVSAMTDALNQLGCFVHQADQNGLGRAADPSA